MLRILHLTTFLTLLCVVTSGDYEGCPPPTKEACYVERPKLCDCSSSCGAGSKCCPVSCGGMECKAVAKPGQCMAHIQSCLSKRPDPIQCDHDFQCTGDLKCCSTSCSGRTCQSPDLTTPVTDDSKVCPYFDPNRYCYNPAPNECTPGNQCYNGHTCCEYECSGTRCEPQLCPAVGPTLHIICIATNKQECNSTDDCGSDAICCSYECGGRKCVPRDKPAHGGSCPIYSGLVPCPHIVPVDECSSDEECYAGKKCCRKICGGLGCMDSVEEARPGKCPDFSAVDVYCTDAVPSDDCSSDGQCPYGQKCCTKPCGGLGCLSIVAEPTRPSKIDSSALLCPMPTKRPDCRDSKKKSCTSDSQCRGTQKCCDTGCKVNTCQTPVRPGTCPSMVAKCRPPTEADKKNQCGTDMSCPANQKCCKNPCAGYGHKCMDPEYFGV